MRFVIASIICAAILAGAFFLTPLLRSWGVPTGGLAMVALSAALACAWLAITKVLEPGTDRS